MDYFTKWPEAYGLSNQEAGTVALVLVNEFISRYGVPAEIHSDQGRNFECAVFTEMCQLLGIHKTRTTALHPQSDGVVGRYNRTLHPLSDDMVERYNQTLHPQCGGVMERYNQTLHPQSDGVVEGYN